MKPALTIHAIAEAAGVSTAAVSKALNARPGVGPKKRLHILKVAQELGYAPYVSARRSGMHVAGGRHIAVLFGPVGPYIVSEVQQGISVALRSSGFFEIFCSLMPEDSHKDEVKQIFLRKVEEDPNVAGLLAAFIDLDARTRERFERRKLPVVLLDGPRAKSGPLNLIIDHAEGAKKAVTALLDQGRKRLAYLGPDPKQGWVWAQRHAGVAATLARARQPMLFEEESYCDMVQAAFATRRLLEREPGVDGILCASDIQAVGCLQMLRDLEIPVPRQVAVIGFDDSPICRAVSPSLSSVRQPFTALGEKGTRALLARVHGRTVSRPVKLATRLILRDSCLPDYAGDRWFGPEAQVAVKRVVK